MHINKSGSWITMPRQQPSLLHPQGLSRWPVYAACFVCILVSPWMNTLGGHWAPWKRLLQHDSVAWKDQPHLPSTISSNSWAILPMQVLNGKWVWIPWGIRELTFQKSKYMGCRMKEIASRQWKLAFGGFCHLRLTMQSYFLIRLKIWKNSQKPPKL